MSKNLGEKLEDFLDKVFPWRWSIWRFWNGIKEFPSEVKWFIQRGRRGYADCDLWNVNYYLLSWLPEALRKLRDSQSCYPVGPGCNSFEDWYKILDEMIIGFEAYRRWEEDYPREVGVKHTNGTYYYNFKDPIWKEKYDMKRKEVEKAYNKSKKLFITWFEALWD